MSLTLNNRVWVLAERLFLFSRKEKTEEFIDLLKQYGVDYPGDPYDKFSTTKGLYTFMSENDFTFAQFMLLVPTYKYIDILEKIVFDESIKITQDDNWNYYGEYVKHWYPDFIDLIRLAGITIDKDNKKLIYVDGESEIAESGDFIPNDFGDLFLDYMKKEINDSYNGGQFLSVMFLARKILETVIVRIFEIVFPKLTNKRYSEANHALWYDKNKNKYHSFDVLLDNLKDNAPSFHEDKTLVLELVSLVKPFKNETNACVHNDYKIPDKSYITQWKIPYIIGMARKLFRKYCNP